MMSALRLRVLAAAGFFTLGGAAADMWSVLPIYGGGYVQNVIVSPSAPNVWYAYVDVGGPYRSDDAGRHWRPLHGNLAGVHRDVAGDCVRTMDVDPRDENSFVMCSGGGFSSPSGIFVSRDGGQTFRKTWNARFYGNGPRRFLGLALARNPFDPDELLAVEDWDGVAHSKDNGETWRVTGLEHLYVTDIRFDRNIKGRVYACALPPPGNRAGDAGDLMVGGRTYGKGFFRSDDSGETWHKLSDEAPNEVCQIKGDAALIGYFSKDVLKRSVDGGVSWEPYAEGLPAWEKTSAGLVKGNFLALAAGPDFYLVGDATGVIYRRRLDETFWSQVETVEKYAGNPPCEPRLQYLLKHPMDALCSLIVDPNDASHWLATDWFEIWESTDAGSHWTTRIDGIMQLVSFTVEADPFSESNLVYGVADMGLFSSSDGGKRWWVPNGWVYACSASYSRKTPKLAMMCGGKWTGMVKRSRSSGRWWEDPALRGLPKLDGSNPGVRAYTIAANPSAEEFLILLSGPVGPGKGGVYRTKNAGDDWEWYGDGLPTGRDLFKESEWGAGGPYPQLYFGCDGSAVCYSAKISKAWYLDKEKETWGEVKGTCGIMASDPYKPGRFLNPGRPIMESLDGGRTFHPFTDCTLTQANYLSFDAHVSGLVVAGLADRSVAVSFDGGVHFAPIKGSEKVPSGCSSKILVDRKRLFYLTTGSGVYTSVLGESAPAVE